MIPKCNMIGFGGFENKDKRHEFGFVVNERCPLNRGFCKEITIGSCEHFVLEKTAEEKALLEGYKEHRVFQKKQERNRKNREYRRRKRQERLANEKMRLDKLMEEAEERGLELVCDDPKFVEIQNRIKQRLAWRRRALKKIERLRRVDELIDKYGLGNEERDVVLSLLKDFEKNKTRWKEYIKQMYAEEERPFVLMMLEFLGEDETWVVA